MQPNRANEPASVSARVSGPVTPPAPRRRRSSGRINPWFIILITALPILVFSCMFLGLGWYTQNWTEQVMAAVPPAHAPDTRHNLALFPQVQLEYNQDARSYALDENGFLNIAGRVTNNTGKLLHDVQLKGEVYRTVGGHREPVGSGVGNVLELPAGQGMDFVIRARISPGPVPPDLGTPAPPAQDYDHVLVYVDQLWVEGGTTGP